MWGISGNKACMHRSYHITQMVLFFVAASIRDLKIHVLHFPKVVCCKLENEKNRLERQASV